MILMDQHTISLHWFIAPKAAGLRPRQSLRRSGISRKTGWMSPAGSGHSFHEGAPCSDVVPGRQRHAGAGCSFATRGGIFSATAVCESSRRVQQAHAARPDDASIDNLIGIADTKLGKIDEANEYYKLAIDVDPKLDGPYKNLAVNYLSTSRYDLAEQALKHAAELAPQDRFIHYYLGEVYLDTSRDREAMIQLQPARTLIETDPELGTRMAAACVRLDMKTEASQLISNLENGPGLNVEEEYRLGVLLTEKKMYAAAVERSQRIVQLQPALWTGKFDLAVALIDANELPEAIAVLEPLTIEHSTDAKPLRCWVQLMRPGGFIPKR